MRNQPVRSTPPSPALAFSRDEWELIVTLPRRVLVAAASAEADPDRRTVAEGIAGMEALAAGRSSRSPLVREVVAAIYAEREPGQPVAEEHAGRRAGLHATLLACQHATELLSDRATWGDAQSYRLWLTAIAWAVCETAKAAHPLGLGGERASVAESHFLDEIQGVLGT